MSAEQLELRAERLRVAICVLEIADDIHAGKYPEAAPLCGQHDLALFRTLSDEDLRLAQTCLDAERDLRRREWGAVEACSVPSPPAATSETCTTCPPSRRYRLCAPRRYAAGCGRQEGSRGWTE